MPNKTNNIDGEIINIAIMIMFEINEKFTKHECSPMNTAARVININSIVIMYWDSFYKIDLFIK